jgi:hypothetical protein
LENSTWQIIIKKLMLKNYSRLSLEEGTSLH